MVNKFTTLRGFIPVGVVSVITGPLAAFDTYSVSWPSGDIPVVLDLEGEDAPVRPSSLIDGSTTWNEVGEDAVAEWNTHLARSQIVTTSPTGGEARRDNEVTEIMFAETIYGDAFGDTVLGVTLLGPNRTNFSAIGEADIIINNTRPWNSYRGALRAGPNDLRRVLLHELGHLLGLSHPDEANPVQTVSALMNSSISDLDRLVEDDITGVVSLYGTPLTIPRITAAPVDQVVSVGDLVTFDMEIGGITAPLESAPGLSIEWYFPDALPQNFPDNLLFIEDRSRLFLGLAQTYDSGTYTMTANNPDGTDSASVELVVNPVPTSPLTQLANLSTRAFTGAGDRALTVGFVIVGDAPLTVLLRAAGPTLAGAPYHVPGTLSDPVLSLRRTLPDGSSTDVAINDDWHDSELATAQEVREVAARLGAFALNEGSADASILISLEPGIYTATVSGSGTTAEGVVIIEAYDVDTSSTGSRLVNLSTRGFVTNDDSTMIAGLVVQGEAARTYLLRVAGDTLADFGVSNPVDDPLMSIFRGPEQVRINDDWDHPPVHQDMLRQKFAELGAFAFTDRQECAMLLTLAPGAYTVKVEGFDEASQGVGLIEFYEVPE